MYKYLILFSVVLFASCQAKVNPNEWVVSTATCWNTYTVSKAGNMIPRMISACDRMVILPATEMGAEFECETKFQNRVAGKVNLTYQWQITDPAAFIQNAKSITSSPTGEGNKIDPNALEAIENGTVDKILIDIIRELTPTLAAGVDELTFEKEVNRICATQVGQRGVQFSNMSANINFDGQTEEALGVISALKFYEANGEGELGRAVIKAKAGAANITTNKE